MSRSLLYYDEQIKNIPGIKEKPAFPATETATLFTQSKLQPSEHFKILETRLSIFLNNIEFVDRQISDALKLWIVQSGMS